MKKIAHITTETITKKVSSESRSTASSFIATVYRDRAEDDGHQDDKGQDAPQQRTTRFPRQQDLHPAERGVAHQQASEEHQETGRRGNRHLGEHGIVEQGLRAHDIADQRYHDDNKPEGLGRDTG
ncbi:hypothetical protein ACFSZS_11815 [Seohaeicola zhoushanensis]